MLRKVTHCAGHVWKWFSWLTFMLLHTFSTWSCSIPCFAAVSFCLSCAFSALRVAFTYTEIMNHHDRINGSTNTAGPYQCSYGKYMHIGSKAKMEDTHISHGSQLASLHQPILRQLILIILYWLQQPKVLQLLLYLVLPWWLPVVVLSLSSSAWQ